MHIKRVGLCLLLAVCTACQDSGSDPSAPGESEASAAGLLASAQALNFLELNQGAALETAGSFWAVKGQSRSIVLYYTGTPALPLLEFVVPANGLLLKPGGELFQAGDSVLITVQLDPTGRLSADFQPSGLIFNPATPARLTMSQLHTNPDIDGDGDHDLIDELLGSNLRVWKQELPGLPWLALPTLRLDGVTLQANILSFTGFALASN